MNAAILRRVIEASGVPATVHALGASDGESGPLYADPKTVPGYETSSVSLNRGLPINMTTLDRRAPPAASSPLRDSTANFASARRP